MAEPGAAMPGGLAWQAILDQAAGPMALLDLQGQFVYLNPAACHVLGYRREELLQRGPREVTHPQDLVIDAAVIEEVLAQGQDSFEVEKRYLRADGTALWALVTSSIIRDTDGRPVLFLSQMQDITARREVELRWRRTMTHAPIGMALLDVNGYWSEVNDALCQLLGYDREELLGRHCTALIYPGEIQSSQDLLADLVAGDRETVLLEKRYRHKDGHPLWVLCRASVVPGADDRPACLVAQYETIGNGRLHDRHLAHMALHDPLTGLANRALLFDRLEQELAKLATSEQTLAVLLADLDGLKPANDRYGHLVGDQLLTTAADALLAMLRPEDTVARLGGDEFVVLAQVGDATAAATLRGRVAHRLTTEITVSGHRLALRASVGLATTTHPHISARELLHTADRDMYQHKKHNPRPPR